MRKPRSKIVVQLRVQAPHERMVYGTGACLAFDREAQEIGCHRVRAGVNDEHMHQREKSRRAKGEHARAHAIGASRMPSNVLEAADGLPQRAIGCDRDDRLTPEIPEDAIAETIASTEPSIAENARGKQRGATHMRT